MAELGLTFSFPSVDTGYSSALLTAGMDNSTLAIFLKLHLIIETPYNQGRFNY